MERRGAGGARQPSDARPPAFRPPQVLEDNGGVAPPGYTVDADQMLQGIVDDDARGPVAPLRALEPEDIEQVGALRGRCAGRRCSPVVLLVRAAVALEGCAGGRAGTTRIGGRREGAQQRRQ
jgi:hypothetical protein